MTTVKSWRPGWWKQDTHGSAWDRFREAMKRDWEQTKADLYWGGHDIGQNIGDTLKQAAGQEAIPPTAQANWSDFELPMGYGYAARTEYGGRFPHWNDELEAKLRTEWMESKDESRSDWEHVKSQVRRGYEYDERGKRRYDKTG